MAGTYSTDLTLIADGSSGTPAEANSYNDGGSLGSGDSDNAIQGTTAFVALTPTQNNRDVSLLANNGSNLNIPATEVLTLYGYHSVPGILGTTSETPPGALVVVGTSTANISTYTVDGSDTYYEGGWRNYVVDLRNTPTGPDNSGGTGNGITNGNQYFGIAYHQNVGPNRSSPYNLDGVRTGRMTLSCQGGTSTTVDNANPLSSTAANFPQAAAFDDHNTGGALTIGGTSQTLVDGGFHRFAQVRFLNGVYLCQGIVRLGVAGTNNEVYFNDSSRSVVFNDNSLTYSDFNRLEIVNTASTVILDSMSFSALGNTARGNFEMVDNASVDIDGCSFLDMGTFIFQSNATIDDCAFRRCNLITTGGAQFTNTTFSRSNGAIATSATTTEDFDTCTFISDGTGYAIDLGTPTGTNTQNVNCTFTGYDTGTDANGGSGGNANSAIRVNLASGNSLTLQVASGTSVPTVHNIAASPGTLSVVQTVNYTIENIRSGTNLQLIEDNGGTLTTIGGVDNVSASPSGVDSGFTVSTDPNNAGRFRVVYQYGYSADRNIYVAAVNVDFQSVYLSDVLGNTDDSIRITQITDRQYDAGSV